jgi:hypothetical protein
VQRSLRSVLPILLVAILALTTRGQSQVIEIRVLNDSGSTRIAGAIVRLLGGEGTPIQGLTNELGRVVLRAHAAGSYRLKIDRIGWSGLVTDPFPLGMGETVRREIRMTSRRVLLPTLTVQGKSSCGAESEAGSAAAVLWEEVRKALTANLLTEQERAVPLLVTQFVREVNLDGRPLREWIVSSKIIRGGSFSSPPVADLVRNGFVQEAGDSVSFAAPDAATILADEFVSTHCFRAVADKQQLAGLAFAPTRGRRVPDVAGTLWIDRPTGELHRLEYSYTGLDEVLRGSKVGGTVEFRHLLAGQWIVSAWVVRMPRMEKRYGEVVGATKLRLELAGYRDRGGHAEVAMDTLGRVDRAIVRGRVYDSTMSAGLPGAVVAVAGTADSIVTDADGRFELAAAASGNHLVTVRHPKLGLLGEPTYQSVMLSLGDTTSAEFAVPGLDRFVRASCSDRPGTVAVVGIVRNARGELAANREVRALKNSVRGSLPLANASRPARSNGHGVYAICGLPPKGTIQLVSIDTGTVLLEASVALEGTSRWVDLHERGSADTSAVPLKLIAKEAALAGLVRADSTRKPIAGVEVMLEGTELSTTTDSSGRFVLGGLPSGDQVALFRLIGWRPLRLEVQLKEADTLRVAPRLIAQGVTLEPITVTGTPKAPRGAGFEAIEERRKLGFGKFFDSTYLARRESVHVDDLLQSIPGIWVLAPRECRGGADFKKGVANCVEYRGKRVAVSGRLVRASGANCLVQIVLDGMVVSRGGNISYTEAFDLNLLRVDELKGIEVYRSAAEIPAEFNDTRAACGVLVLWTKP